MPANSGAITGTKAHKHSAPSADGGFLDDNVTGVTGTSTGSLVYFDASSIAQNLAIGNNGDSLNVAGGLPVWTGAAGAPPYELVATGVLGAPATSLSVSFAAINWGVRWPNGNSLTNSDK